MAERVDLDELARLEEERDFLLRSIDDLDREHEAGDVDDADYEELRRGYVARAADAIRAVESGTDTLSEQQAAGRVGRGRMAMWGVVVVAFAAIAGVLLANALGSRSSGGTVTGQGAVPGSESDRCRTLSFQKPTEGIACYDKLLADRPDDVDALTYQGWAKVRSGDVAGGSKLFDRVVELQPDFPDVHVFRASVAKNAGDFATAQAELDRLYALNPSPAVVSTMQQMGLDKAVALGLLAPDTKACWDKETAAIAAVSDATAVAAKMDRTKVAGALADVAISVKCLDAVLAQRPTDVNALEFRSLGIGVLGLIDGSSYPAALADADAALAVAPNDPTGLLLQAMWRNNTDDVAGAKASLDALGDRRVSPLVAQFLDVNTTRAQVEAAAAAASSTTTPDSASVSSAPTTTTP